MLTRKGYDNHHCHNKPPDRKWDWNADDVMPRRDGPENLRIVKKSQLKVDNGPCRQIIEFLPLGHRVQFSIVAAAVKIFGSLPTEILNTTRCAMRWDGVSIVSLLVLKNRNQKLINAFIPEQQSPPVFACFHLHLCICICKCTIGLISLCIRVVYNIISC